MNYSHSGPIYQRAKTDNVVFRFATWECRRYLNLTIIPERSTLVVLSALYQEYLMTFKLITSQVVQRARPLITRVCVIGGQRDKRLGILTPSP